MKLLKKLLFFLLLVFWLTSGSTLASSPAINLQGQWLFHQSDHILNLSDIPKITNWKTVSTPGLIRFNPVDGIYGTYRYRFSASKDFYNSSEAVELFLRVFATVTSLT